MTLAITWWQPSASVASWAVMTLRLSPSVIAMNRSAPSAPARRRVSSSVPSPRRAAPAIGAGQPVEGLGRGIDDDHLVTGPVEAVGEDRAHPAASDDDDLHAFSSWIGSRTTQTAHGAFFST